MAAKPIIFTDMDGTLLDHNTYSAAPAAKMLTQLKNQHIAVVPNTSKTFAELLELRQQLDLDSPFIVENGAAVYLPANFFPRKPSQCQFQDGFWLKTFTQPRPYWIALLNQQGKAYQGQYEAFHQMSLSRLRELTGLSRSQAEQARQRQFGEPLHWLGDESSKQAFIADMTAKGATVLQGGRFVHICGQCDKGTALRWLTEQFIEQWPERAFYSIALGDSGNDIAMLEAADTAVRIRSAHHAPPNLNRSANLYTSTAYGPEGWAEVLADIIPTNDMED